MSGSESLGYSLVLAELSVSELLAKVELMLELEGMVRSLFLRWRRWPSLEFMDAVSLSEFEELDEEDADGELGLEGSEGLLWAIEEFSVV